MNTCKYCGYKHGVISDVICPIPLATSEFYQRKHKPIRLTHIPYASIKIVVLHTPEEMDKVLCRERLATIKEIATRNFNSEEFMSSVYKRKENRKIRLQNDSSPGTARS